MKASTDILNTRSLHQSQVSPILEGKRWNILFHPVLLYLGFFLSAQYLFFVMVRNYIFSRHPRISKTNKTNVWQCCVFCCRVMNAFLIGTVLQKFQEQIYSEYKYNVIFST